MRILMITPSSPLTHGGVERHVLEVSRRLVAAGATVKVLCSNPGGDAVVESYTDGVRITIVRGWPANRDWRFAPGIWREAARGDWDLVHVQSYHTLVAPLAMLRALRLGIPYVVTFHGGGHSSSLRHRLRGVQRRLLRPLLVRATRLIAVARFEIDLYCRELKIGSEKFVLIPNGTDIQASGGAGEDAEPRSVGTMVLASIGRLERYKGHHRVIAAFAHVLARRPDSRLLIVGTGPYEGALRAQVAALGLEDRVQFTSMRPGDGDGMAALLRQIDLVVLLSDFETHPLTGLEAAAAGRRLLVADRAGLLELADQGMARAISPAARPDLVARTIIEELARPQPPRAMRLTTWDQCANDLMSLYHSVIRTTR